MSYLKNNNMLYGKWFKYLFVKWALLYTISWYMWLFLKHKKHPVQSFFSPYFWYFRAGLKNPMTYSACNHLESDRFPYLTLSKPIPHDVRANYNCKYKCDVGCHLTNTKVFISYMHFCRTSITIILKDRSVLTISISIHQQQWI